MLFFLTKKSYGALSVTVAIFTLPLMISLTELLWGSTYLFLMLCCCACWILLLSLNYCKFVLNAIFKIQLLTEDYFLHDITDALYPFLIYSEGSENFLGITLAFQIPGADFLNSSCNYFNFSWNETLQMVTFCPWMSLWWVSSQAGGCSQTENCIA